MEINERCQQPEKEGNEPISKSNDPTNFIIQLIGMGLLIGFIFPVAVLVRGTLKFLFLNVHYFLSGERISFLLAIQLLYPLFAGIVIFNTAKWKRGPGKAMTLSILGLFPFFIFLLIFLLDSQFHQMLEKVTDKFPGGISLVFSLVILFAATVAILAGAHAARVNPDKKNSLYVAAVGGGLYCLHLLIPVNGQSQLIMPFKMIFASDTSGTGLSIVMGLMALTGIALMLIIVVQCFKLLKQNTQKTQVGNRIIGLWLIQLCVYGILVFFLMKISTPDVDISTGGLLLMFITIIIKGVPWVLGLFFLLPLGIAEFLLLHPAPKPLNEKKEKIMDAVEKSKPVEGPVKSLPDKLTGSRNWILLAIGIGLFISFFLPIGFSKGQHFKFVFLNFDIFAETREQVWEQILLRIQAIYPLIAGTAAIILAYRKRSVMKSLTLLFIGLSPFLLLIGIKEIQQFTTRLARSFHDVTTIVIMVTLLILAAAAVLAGAHAVRLNPGKIKAGYVAAVGGGMYLLTLFIPINGQLLFISSLQYMTTRVDLSGVGFFFVFGLVILLGLILITALGILSLLLLKQEPGKARIAKAVIIVWFLQLFLYGAFSLYILMADLIKGVSFDERIFLTFSMVIIKFVPWVLGLFLLIPLGIAELLLLKE